MSEPNEDFLKKQYGDVNDVKARRLLWKRIDKRQSSRELYGHFLDLINKGRDVYLIPSPLQDEAVGDDRDAYSYWDAVQKNLRACAEHLCRGGAEQWLEVNKGKPLRRWRWRRRPRDTRDRSLIFIARDARALMRFWLRVNMLRERAEVNFQIEEVDAAEPTEQQMVKLIGKHIAEYYAMMKEFDRIIFAKTHLRILRWQDGDITMFRTLRKEFGPNELLDNEVQWEGYVNAVSTDLRFQYYTAFRRERQVQRNFLGASAIWFLQLGLKPRRFVYFVFLTVIFFMLSYSGSDYLTHNCAGFSMQNIPDYIGYHFFESITNLVSLGSYAAPCGWATPWLLSTEAVSGYFLLAILAAIFIEGLLD